ncbi:hypothetical protein Tco_0995301 [Tanacetum coccineum]
MSQDVMLTMMNSIDAFGDFENLEIKKSETCNKSFDLEAELVKRKNMVERDIYTELSNSFAKLEKHYISLELNIQLNQQIFQKDKSCENQNALEFLEYFENNDLKAQLQEKDTTINKLRNHIKSLRESDKKDRVKQDMDENETINIELEHSVAKLLSENELLHKEIKHLKNIYKDQFDSIKKLRPLSKEQCDSLIAQLNSKFMENVDLKGSSKKAKIVESRVANNSEPSHSWGSNATDVPSSSSIINDRLSRLFSGIMGYGDYQLGNITISWVYYVEGLRHNLFSIGQFYDSDLEVAFRKNTCFIRNLDGVDLLFGSRDTNLYTISLDDMLKTSPIYLLSKASMTKSCLWHRRLSHLNFGLVPNPVPQQPCNLPTKNDWDCLFQPIFDEYFNPPPSDISPVQVADTPRAIDLADSPVSTSIDQDSSTTL